LLGDNAKEVGYMYRDNGDGTWAPAQVLTAAPQSNLGYSVALDRKIAVLGSLPPERLGRSGAGYAYAFLMTEGAWVGPVDLVPNDNAPYSAGFGRIVAVSGSTVVVGASRAMESGVELGAAYVFDLDLSGLP
jgi:hypothetical protein